jgi:hypothetical protein
LIDVAAVTESEVVGLFARARAAAARLVSRMIQPLLKRVDAVAETLAKTGVEPVALPSLNLPIPDVGGYVPSLPVYQPSMRQVVRELGDQFNRAGFVPGNEYGIATGLSPAGWCGRMSRGGRGDGARRRSARSCGGCITARFWTIGRRSLCRGLDGTTLPTDAAFWQQWTPPNHYGCRSCVIEVWESSKLREPPASVQAYQRFGSDFFVG